MEKNPEATPLTLEEEVEEIFRKFDSNGDGKISLTELGSILGSLGSATSADGVARIMSEMDSDGDGFIDLNDFKVFYRDTGGNKELKEAFDVYDMDKNGKISAIELHTVLKSLGDKRSLNDCRKMIRSVDDDGDECVSFEEFKKMMTRNRNS
ncbi:hypothetical protein OROHE_002604 [Orobanche hederae]